MTDGIHAVSGNRIITRNCVQHTNLFHSLKLTIPETLNMIRKGQVKGVSKGNIMAGVKFIADIFAVIA